MPHDKYGTELKVGDRVTMEFRVVQVCATEEHCNVSLESVELRYPSEHKTVLGAVNTRQVVRVDQ